MLIFWKVSHHNDRESISNFFGLESVGNISTIHGSHKFRQFWNCWACKKGMETWNYLCFWPSGMKPRNISCYTAYLDGFSPDCCNTNSDKFYYVIVSVSSLVLTQQKQKYLKENTGGWKEGNGNYIFFQARFVGLCEPLYMYCLKKDKANPKTYILYTRT